MERKVTSFPPSQCLNPSKLSSSNLTKSKISSSVESVKELREEGLGTQTQQSLKGVVILIVCKKIIARLAKQDLATLEFGQGRAESFVLSISKKATFYLLSFTFITSFSFSSIPVPWYLKVFVTKSRQQVACKKTSPLYTTFLPNVRLTLRGFHFIVLMLNCRKTLHHSKSLLPIVTMR